MRARKLDMEMPPDTLAVFGVNEVVVTVEPSVTTEQADSGSLGTHRTRSSNSNTVSISSMLFFWNEHLSSASRLERVRGCPYNLASS